MKSLLLYTLLLLLTLQLNAQNPIAKLKYEQAEEAFNNNDFFTTIAKLEEAEKLLGESNPRILYLRIMAQSNLLDNDKSILPSLKENCAYYLKNYSGNGSIEEKYKEVYLVSDKVVDLVENEHNIEGNKHYRQKNYEVALTHYLKAAATGYAPAFINLGRLYEWGYGVEKDYSKAFQWYKRAVDKDFWEGYYYLGKMYYNGYGVEKNANKALELFNKGILKNDLRAMEGIGDIYNFHSEDYQKALEWYLKAANKGHVGVEYKIGYIYHYRDLGTSKNYAKAMEWYLKSSHSIAANTIGILYEHGQGVPKDYAKAMEWYSKHINAYSCNNIGKLYKEGSGVRKDWAMALEWFLKAAELGSTHAPGHIASMYEIGGRGVTVNKKLAKEWREKEAIAKAKK